MSEEEHVAKDIKVTRKIGKSVLDHFAHISNENETKRVKNGSLLLQYLYKSSSNKDTAEIKYALKRIVRGLGGSTVTSRAGFYSTFVALLRTFPHLTLEDVLECMRGNLQTEGGYSKSEAGELYAGQILACGALIRSNKIFTGTREEKEHVLRVLVNAGKSRSYLSLASVRFLSELITTSSEKQFKELWHVLNTEIVKPWPSQNHDTLYLMLLTYRQFPTIFKGGILQKAIGTPEILCEPNLEAICNIVLNPPSFSTLKHFLYPLLGETLASTNHEIIFVAELDRHLVRSNRIKLMAASLLVRHLLTNCQDSTKIPNLLSDNFIKQLLQYYRNRTNRNDAEFQDEIASLFDSLCKSLQRDTVDVKTKLKVMKKLIFHPGSFMFESVTKSKNIQKLVRILDGESVKKLGGLYRDVLVMKRQKVCENKTESWLNSERIYAAQLLAKLLNLPVVQAETSWKVKNLQLLMDVAIVGNKYANVGIELANNVKETFYRALDLKFGKLDEVASVLGELVGYLRTECDHLRIALSEDELGLLHRLCSITAKKAEDECGLVFRVLFLHMGLQLFNDKELAVSSLNELFACHEKIAHKQMEGDESDPEWIDVVVDLFLNLLSHNSLLLRNIVGAVFPYLCKYVTASSLHQILSVLDPNSDTNPLSVDESDSESESDDSEEVESDLEDETVNDRLRMAVRDALGSNGYQTDEESVDLDDMTEEDAERLDKALGVAFKQFKPNRGKSKKQTKQEETLTHFRIRAMDLLEIYLDSEPVMLSCLEMMLPLLQMLEFSIRDEHQKPLLMRIRHCIRKLSNLKKFSSTDGVTETIVGDFLNKLLEKGTKNAMLVQEMSNEISDCCIFVIKCSQNDTLHPKMRRKCEKRITKILENALVVYFKQRDCLTPYGFVKSIFQLNWEGCLKFVPLLFNFVFDMEIRPFRRNQALELLRVFYQNRRVHGKYAEIVGGHERDFLDNVVRIMDDFCRNPEEKTIREKFIYNLLSLLKTIHSHPGKNAEVDWGSIGAKVREFRSHVPLSKDAKAMYNQLCGAMKIPRAVKMSESVVKFSNKEVDDEPSPKKQGPAIEARKLKKEAKTRRIQHMSEGIGSFSFTSLRPVENISDNDDSVSSSKVNGVRRKRRKSESDLEKVSRKKAKHNLTNS